MKLIVFIAGILAFCKAAKLPDYIPKCSKSDPNLTTCLANSANTAWSKIIQGDRNAHIQVLNPFFVPFLRMEVDQKLHGNLTDTTITGLEETTFDSINFNMDKKTIDVKFHMPRLNFAGGYEVSGQLLFLPIEGKGPANFTYMNMENDLHIDYTLKEENGKQYIEIEKNLMTYKISRGYFRLDNLFGGDERLGEAMNKVLDESWEAVNEEVGARIGEAIGAAYSAMLQLFFRKVSINELFSD